MRSALSRPTEPVFRVLCPSGSMLTGPDGVVVTLSGAVGLKGVAQCPLVAVELWQTQLAFAIGLLGVYIGWRGVISKMTGFYDLAGAVKYLLYGLVSGMLLAMAVDRIILPAIILSSLNIISVSLVALLIGATEAAFVMFLVARPRVVALRGSPPY